MSAVYWRDDAGEARVRASKYAAVLFAASRVGGVYFHFREGAYETHGLTTDARPVDVRRWEAGCALQSLGRAVREHEKLAADPMMRWLMFYVAVDYLAALFGERR